jgi:beta-lactam-binding protein with PASTA domain
MRVVTASLAVLAVCAILSACGGVADVRVPSVRGMTPAAAYRALHKAGFRVAVRNRDSAWDSLYGNAQSGWVIPRVGSEVRPGTVVRLVIVSGDFGSPVGLTPRPVRTPSFVGKSATSAIGWAEAHNVLWYVRLPSLPPSSAPNLYDAYRVIAQKPTPGKISTRSNLTLKIEPR